MRNTWFASGTHDAVKCRLAADAAVQVAARADDAMDCTTVLLSAQSPDLATRQAAEQQLEQAKASNLVRPPRAPAQQSSPLPPRGAAGGRSR